MISCNKCTSLFEKSLNNELMKTEVESMNEHIESCRKCASELTDLNNTLRTMKEYISPEPRKDFIDKFWETIEPEIIKKEEPSSSWLNNLSNLIFGKSADFGWAKQLAGAAVLLTIGVLLGKYYFTPGGHNIETRSFTHNITTEQRAVRVKAENYIERSKVLLLGLMNFDPAIDDVSSINLEQQKRISRVLLGDAENIKSNLTLSSQNNLKELVNDLEIILMQIANLESEQDITGIELVKEGVDKRGIFLKINIQELLGSNIKSSYPDQKPGKSKKEI